MAAQERSFEENMTQLEEKMNRERENLLGEQETMLNHKQKVSLDGPWQGLMDKMLASQE